MNENTNLIYSLASFSLSQTVHLTFSSQNTIRLQLSMLPFFQPIFYGGFKFLLRNASKDHLGFLDHLGICFDVPAA